MTALFPWWLAVSMLGWLSWPILTPVFGCVPGKGYAFSRAIGLLLLSYAFWILTLVGIVPNTTGALWVVAGLLAVVCGIAWWAQRRDLTARLRTERRHILTVELLFAAMLLLYALYKAHDPAIDHTEEPMDFCFLNGILQSGGMPPNDPWLSGHAISYYYLGHYAVSLLVRLTGATAGVGYNLGLAQSLALTTIGCYGVLYSVVASRDHDREATRGAQWTSLIGGLAIPLAGSLEGVLELARALGWGPEALYAWLAVPGLDAAPPTHGLLPSGRWWWWRASRIIVDHNYLGRIPTVITEFPIFSFILGDMHPHVLALPYALAALGIAVALYSGARQPPRILDGRVPWQRVWGWALVALVLGALGFLNSWDLPTYLAVVLASYAIGRWRGIGEWKRWARDVALVVSLLGLGSILLYLPFYAELSTQAQGLGLVYYAKTPLKHFVLHFGVWLLPIVVEALDARSAIRSRIGPRRTVVSTLAVWAALLTAPWALTAIIGGPGRLLLGLGSLVTSGPWLLLSQSLLLAIILTDLWFGLVQSDQSPGQSWAFSRILAAVGLGLTYVTEFFYLRDAFDTRMNTVFKLYYQAWILLGLSAALCAWRLWHRSAWRRLAVAASVGLVCVSLYYGVAAGYTRASQHKGAPTLDGTGYLREADPDEYATIAWIRKHSSPEDVLLEAEGTEFDASTSRLSGWTGIPTVLGWPGHEVQWRGDDAEVLRRSQDVETVYRSEDPTEVAGILDAYNVRYLVVGPSERERYELTDGRLAFYDRFLDRVFERGGIVIFNP